jgi:hypothetical protein
VPAPLAAVAASATPLAALAQEKSGPGVTDSEIKIGLSQSRPWGSSRQATFA